MVGKVTVWQCKCGMHIKVVAEAESEQPPNHLQYSACPQCGDTQVVYADNIISVSEDRSAMKPETPT
jgi:hypothetical protein